MDISERLVAASRDVETYKSAAVQNSLNSDFKQEINVMEMNENGYDGNRVNFEEFMEFLGSRNIVDQLKQENEQLRNIVQSIYS